MNYKFNIEEAIIPISEEKDMVIKNMQVEVEDLSIPDITTLLKSIPSIVKEVKKIFTHSEFVYSNKQTSVESDQTESIPTEFSEEWEHRRSVLAKLIRDSVHSITAVAKPINDSVSAFHHAPSGHMFYVYDTFTQSYPPTGLYLGELEDYRVYASTKEAYHETMELLRDDHCVSG
ncbi:hypothetical protein ACK8P5_25940 (plasmid) [Paenibacillus sp. EC2-1]|uniref:hypothetical protein n=1 Tax=Paenibacillus sp. EC2-1 TaxID=3388665 RepID=UPI003BEEC165